MAVLFSMGAHAQAPAASTAPLPDPTASRQASPESAAEAAPPRYGAQDLKRAFDFMDGNHDGKISREEASGFRGVARHFDQADTNKDNFLSRDEFARAMNYVKPK